MYSFLTELLQPISLSAVGRVTATVNVGAAFAISSSAATSWVVNHRTTAVDANPGIPGQPNFVQLNAAINQGDYYLSVLSPPQEIAGLLANIFQYLTMVFILLSILLQLSEALVARLRHEDPNKLPKEVQGFQDLYEEVTGNFHEHHEPRVLLFACCCRRKNFKHPKHGGSLVAQQFAGSQTHLPKLRVDEEPAEELKAL